MPAPSPSLQGRFFALVAGCLVLLGACTPDPRATASFEEFCLRGEFDLSARLQGRSPHPGERYPATWCVISSPDDERVHFSQTGRSNPDMDGTFALSYLASDLVRLVFADDPPDVEFRGASARNEASSVRRIDPLRLLAELDERPEWIVAEGEGVWVDVSWPGATDGTSIQVEDGRLSSVRTMADLPLKGRVAVTWNWTWLPDNPEGMVDLVVDGEPVFRATASRRALSLQEAGAVWRPSGGEPPREVPGAVWPAVVDMSTDTIGPGVHVVRGVRSGFHHLVVETGDGLVVVDAPAGWVEMHRLPPTDLVPGLGVSGLSELFVDYLAEQWPGVPVRAVVLTHAHDDHAGGARAFAAAGAEIYAPAEVAGFLEEALNRPTMPDDRLSESGRTLGVIGVADRFVLSDATRPVELIPFGVNPHVDAALGVYVPSARVFFQSDLLVPNSTAPTPRPDRLASDCWFAGWVSESLPPETGLHNSHSAVSLSAADVAEYLEQGVCRARGG